MRYLVYIHYRKIDIATEKEPTTPFMHKVHTHLWYVRIYYIYIRSEGRYSQGERGNGTLHSQCAHVIVYIYIWYITIDIAKEGNLIAASHVIVYIYMIYTDRHCKRENSHRRLHAEDIHLCIYVSHMHICKYGMNMHVYTYVYTNTHINLNI